MKTDINMFLFNIEHFWSDIRGPKYLHLKKVYFFVGHPVVYLRPLISLSKSSVLEMNPWISSFKNTNSKFSRIFVFRDIKGIRYYSRISGYS